MRRPAFVIALLIGLGTTAAARAGLYNTAEPELPLEPNLVKFLDQLKVLRGYVAETDEKKKYLAAITRLREEQKKRPLTPQEVANLGAYLIRVQTTRFDIPRLQEAQDVLQTGAQKYPRDFYIQANLGTLHQLMGDFDLASRALDTAKSLAPTPALRRMEHFHWLLVDRRAAEGTLRQPAPLDRLFPMKFVGESGQWEVGKIAAAQKALLPDGSISEAKRIVQQLLVWFPDDGRLHWLLGELANADGDLSGAYWAMDAAVYNFKLAHADLKEHRSALQVFEDEKIEAQKVKAKEDQARLQNELLNPQTGTEKTGSAFTDMNTTGWVIAVVGGVLILGLIFLQVRQLFRRRKPPQLSERQR